MGKFTVGDRVRHTVDLTTILGTVTSVQDHVGKSRLDWYTVIWDARPDPADTPYSESVLEGADA